MHGPRVELLAPADAPLLARPFYAPEGETSPIVRALAQVPELLGPTMRFVSAALGPAALDLRAKELIILRVSALAGCRYCVGAHRVAAHDAGVTPVEADALVGRRTLAEAFGPADAALLALADAVAAGGVVEPALVDDARRFLGDAGVVEAVTCAAATLMLNRLCTALELPLSAATSARLAELDPSLAGAA